MCGDQKKGSSQSSASSLKQTITLGSANFSADATTYRNGELYTVALTVFNEGYQEGSCKAIFYDMETLRRSMPPRRCPI